jgi:hypothetical protein
MTGGNRYVEVIVPDEEPAAKKPQADQIDSEIAKLKSRLGDLDQQEAEATRTLWMHNDFQYGKEKYRIAQERSATRRRIVELERSKPADRNRSGYSSGGIFYGSNH